MISNKSRMSTIKEIELEGHSRLTDTVRTIRQNLLNQQEAKALKKESHKSRVPIFEPEAFWVAPMSDPFSYISRDRYRENQETGVEVVKHACGECVLGCSNLCACCCCKCYMYELQTSKVGLVQRFGRFSRLLTPGFNLINPCSEEVREVDMSIKVVNAGITDAITRDNVEIKVFSSVAYRVKNPILAEYVIGANLQRGITELVTSSFRNTIGIHELQKVLTDRTEIIREVKEQVIKNMPVGISIENVFLEDIQVPKNIERDLSSVAKERRLAQASIIESKADVQAAALMKETAQLLDTKAAMQIRYLEMVQSLGKRGVTLMMEIGVNKKGFKEY